MGKQGRVAASQLVACIEGCCWHGEAPIVSLKGAWPASLALLAHRRTIQRPGCTVALGSLPRSRIAAAFVPVLRSLLLFRQSVVLTS
jgi:hypothetical protein